MSTENQVEETSSVVADENQAQLVVNTELDSFVDDAVKTKQESDDELKEEQDKEKPLALSEEEAADLALTGLAGAIGLARGFSGKSIEISPQFQMVFAALTTPCLMKYGDKIKKAMQSPSKVDLDSWMPEVMALGGVALVGVPMYMQATEPEQPETAKDTEDKKDASEQPSQVVH